MKSDTTPTAATELSDSDDLLARMSTAYEGHYEEGDTEEF
jgi:hypothetical protein